MSVQHAVGGVSCSDEDDRIEEAARSIAARRALIERARGMLMLVYGIDADEAFELLRRQSQHHNVKLRFIAEQILTELVELSRRRAGVQRSDADALLLTAHRRIAAVSARQTEDGHDRIAG